MSRAARAAFVAVLCVIWGSTWLAIKFAIDGVPPFLAAGVRFAIAAAVLGGLSAARGVPFPRGARLHLGLFALGLTTFVVSYGAVYWGEQYIASGLSAVLFSTYPLFVLLLAHAAVEAEPITPRRLAGVVIGLLGVVLIFRSDLSVDHPRAFVGAAVTMISPVASGLGSVGVKRWGRDLHPYVLTTLPMTYGAAGLLAASAALEPWEAVRWTASAGIATLYLAVFGSVIAFVTYYKVLKEVAVSSLALITYVFPVVALALGWLVLGETLRGDALAGAAAIVAGIALATSRRRGSHGRDPESEAAPLSPASSPAGPPRPT